MAELTPITRLEQLIVDAKEGTTPTQNAITRVEMFLAKIAGANVVTPSPITRIETFLASIAGEAVTLPKPLTRIETFLAAIAGEDVETPTPITRVEIFLAEWAEGGGGSVVKTITGEAPITFDALAATLVSLTQDGKTVQDGTPTPDNPVDIVCNNGTLKMVDDELPIGYKRVASIKFDGGIHYETGEALSGDDDVTMTLDDTSTTGQNIFGSYNGTSSGAVNFSLFIYGGGSSTSSYFRYGTQLLRPRFGSGERTITFGKSGTDGFASDATATPDTFTTPANAYIGMLPNSTSPAYTGTIVGNITVGTRLKWIPCEREADGAVGYYEAVNGNFIAPTGTGTPTKGAYDYTHAHLEVVGTPEVLFVAPSGSATQDGTPAPDNYVPVVGTKMGDTELFAIDTDADTYDPSTQTITRVIGKAVLNGTESFGKSTAYGTSWYITSAASSWGANKEKTVICTHFVAGTAQSQADNHTCFFNASGHFYFRASEFADAAAFKAWVKEQYDNGTPVVVYFVSSSSTTEAYTGSPVGGTASVADLYAVNDYKDTHELIGGVVKRNVGIKVLDGTESGWALSDSGTTHRFRGVKPTDCHTPASRAPSVCTHFKYVSTGSAVGGMFIGASQYWYFIHTDQTIDTVDEWTAWLAEQYAQGTPVIVLYPLATETTESVQGQRLHSASGENTISVVSNVDPVNLTVEYKAEPEEVDEP